MYLVYQFFPAGGGLFPSKTRRVNLPFDELRGIIERTIIEQGRDRVTLEEGQVAGNRRVMRLVGPGGMAAYTELPEDN